MPGPCHPLNPWGTMMRNIFKFIRSMNFNGLTISVENEFLKVEPRSLLTDNIREEIKKYKTEIVGALLGTAADSIHGGNEIPDSSCWGCAHYDGLGSAWPGMCRHSYPSREIDTNPDNGCRFFVKAIQGCMNAWAPRITTNNLPSPVAISWLAENKKALRGHGWTMSELYRRNKSKRGLAWLGLWQRTDLEVSLLSCGVIQFYLKDREIIQTARPKKLTI